MLERIIVVALAVGLCLGCEPGLGTCEEKVQLSLNICCGGKCPMQESDAAYLDGLDSCRQASMECDVEQVECTFVRNDDKYASSYQRGCTVACECY